MSEDACGRDKMSAGVETGSCVPGVMKVCVRAWAGLVGTDVTSSEESNPLF